MKGLFACILVTGGLVSCESGTFRQDVFKSRRTDQSGGGAAGSEATPDGAANGAETTSTSAMNSGETEGKNSEASGDTIGSQDSIAKGNAGGDVESSESIISSCRELSSISSILIFDNSSSQSNSDLLAMRQGAQRIVNQLMNLRAQHAGILVQAGAVRFSSARNAAIGVNGWVDLSAGREKLDSDIIQATSSNSGSTQYIPALIKANELLARQAGLRDKSKAANFVLFMSDGRPDDDEAEIIQHASGLVRDFGIRFISVAIGSDDFEVLESMTNQSSPLYDGTKPKTHFVSESRASTNVAATFGEVEKYFAAICPPR
jgi:uncharacterized protein YegL